MELSWSRALAGERRPGSSSYLVLVPATSPQEERRHLLRTNTFYRSVGVVDSADIRIPLLLEACKKFHADNKGHLHVRHIEGELMADST